MIDRRSHVGSHGRDCQGLKLCSKIVGLHRCKILDVYYMYTLDIQVEDLDLHRLCRHPFAELKTAHRSQQPDADRR